MSMLIKGMDMPREGASLFIEVNSTGHIICQYSDDIVHYGYKNRAVSVPTPHGRLIDADDLKDRIDYADAWVLGAIDRSLTVIEAEEG